MSIQYDETGLTIQTLSEILEDREEQLKQIFGSSFNISGDTVIGNVQTADADREYDIQELLEFLVMQLYFANSEGIFLDWNAFFRNQLRLTPLKTIITRTINGDVGTVINKNDLTITDTDINEDFILYDTVTIQKDGKVQAKFESMLYESVDVGESDSFTIATPILGVETISFETGDGVYQVGRVTETDDEFKQRIDGSSLVGSIGLSEAIKQKILLLDGVEACTFLENKSSTNYMYEEYSSGTGKISISQNSFTITGSSGSTFLTELDTNYSLKWDDDLSDEQTAVVASIESPTSLTIINKSQTDTLTPTTFEFSEPTLPPNSFEMIVLGGDSEEIAQTILDNEVPTTQTYGNTYEDIEDSEGQIERVYFTIPDEININMQMDVYYNSILTVDEQQELKQALVDYWDSLKSEDINKGIGLDIDADDFAQISNINSKIKKIRNIEIEDDANPGMTDYISIANREIANLATTDITLNLIAA